MKIRGQEFGKGQQKLNRIMAEMCLRASDLRVPMKRFGVHMTQSSIPEQFRRGGQPSWKPSAKKSGKTMIGRTRRLGKSWTARATKDVLTIGTNIMYARVQQYGKVIRAKRAKFLTFHIPGIGWRRSQKVTITARPTRIRPGDITRAKVFAMSWIKRRS